MASRLKYCQSLRNLPLQGGIRVFYLMSSSVWALSWLIISEAKQQDVHTMLLNFKWTPVYCGNTALEQVLPFVLLQPAWPETLPPGTAPQRQKRHPQKPLHHDQVGEVLPLLPQGKMYGAKWFTFSAGMCLAHLFCVSVKQHWLHWAVSLLTPWECWAAQRCW